MAKAFRWPYIFLAIGVVALGGWGLHKFLVRIDESNSVIKKKLNHFEVKLSALEASQSDLHLKYSNFEKTIAGQGQQGNLSIGAGASDGEETWENSQHIQPMERSLHESLETSKEAPNDTFEYESRLASWYEYQIINEPVDPDWSYSMENDISQSFVNGQMGNSKMKRIKCASTMCVVGISFDNEEAVEDFILATRQVKPWSEAGEMFLRREGYEDYEVEVYIARQGQYFQKFNE